MYCQGPRARHVQSDVGPDSVVPELEIPCRWVDASRSAARGWNWFPKVKSPHRLLNQVSALKVKTFQPKFLV